MSMLSNQINKQTWDYGEEEEYRPTDFVGDDEVEGLNPVTKPFHE